MICCIIKTIISYHNKCRECEDFVMDPGICSVYVVMDFLPWAVGEQCIAIFVVSFIAPLQSPNGRNLLPGQRCTAVNLFEWWSDIAIVNY